jgi:DNA-binding PadR family transcriptional regulator
MRALSFAAVSVMKVIAEGARHGFDIMDAAGLPSGTVYPILGRMEESGYVRSRWEAPSLAQKAKRPARRYYEITRAGEQALAASIEHYRTLGGLIPSAGRPGRTKA